ncbi:hypothetical protein BFN03_12715 [Rhodococcus sp. WMMA185]|uniref:hypothetical protein n=1 Tax=Rhodococcus sp. WMMA185 TaxID=679318 RepID=UPI0008782350|nr:hypothetical protein [Rhodococcus sp. WMMA185]AOW93213.1 hypothetical protein BFN03_12715 [Rhodococcus sp. WMMA185]
MTEDSQQISVSELLKRNGQQVESSGGRRRRGAKGGISVAELTGEIPTVRSRSEARARNSEEASDRGPVFAREQAPDREPAQPEPAQEAELVPEPAPAPVSEGIAALSGRFDADVDLADDDVADADARRTGRPSSRVNGTVSSSTSRDYQGSWVSRTLQQDLLKTGIVVPATESDSAVPVAEEPEHASGGTDFLAEPSFEAPDVAEPSFEAPDVAEPSFEAPDVAEPSFEASDAATQGSEAPDAPKPRPESSAASIPEPQLLSGSTLAGDLMRQFQDSGENVGEETEIIEAAAGGTRTEPREGETEDSEAPKRSRKEAKAKAKEKKFSWKDGVGEDSAREWLVLLGQGVVAVIAGALLFKGFEKLWDLLPWVALILALLVIVGLVAMVRVVRRTDDITSFVIAVVVGMIVTLGPLALMLASG